MSRSLTTYVMGFSFMISINNTGLLQLIAGLAFLISLIRYVGLVSNAKYK